MKYSPVSVIFCWCLFTIILIGAVFVAFDGLHYWHDIRFMYATSQFDIQAILSGKFNPHQAWSAVNEEGAAGFYDSKMLHIILLHAVFTVLKPNEGGLQLVVALSFLTVSASIYFSYRFFAQLFASRDLMFYSVSSMLLAPIMLYISGKLLSEITSFLLSTVGLLLLIKAKSAGNRNGFRLASVSGIFIALASLARLDSIFGVVGYAVASIVVPTEKCGRRRTIRLFLIASSVSAMSYAAVIALSGIQPDAINNYYHAFTSAGQKSKLMSLMGFATFGGAVLVTAIIGLFSNRIRLVAFFALWFVATLVPVTVIAWQYMIEPRYLIQGILPLVGLSALGVELVGGYFSLATAARKLLLAGVVTMVIGINYIVVRLMPYELDRPAALAAVASIQQIDENAKILIPWSYTDFNFFHVMLPDARIFNVNSPPPATDSNNMVLWELRFTTWYGDAYVQNADTLEELLEDGPVYYLGWEVYPPIQNIQDFADKFGLTTLTRIIRKIELTNHLEQSWLWDSPVFSMTFAGRVGQYHYFKVVSK